MIHPSTRLLLWCLVVGASQHLEGVWVVAAALVLLMWAFLATGARIKRLLMRTRWLMLAMFSVFAWGTPGYLLWAEAGWASPSLEGLLLATNHILRLVCTLALVAILLESTPTPRLVAGLYGLARPLDWLGLDRGRAATRLELVLRYAESASPTRSWREWLDGAVPVAQSSVILEHLPFRALDGVAVVGAVVLLGWWFQ